MGKCLVKKLQEIVNDDMLLCPGELYLTKLDVNYNEFKAYVESSELNKITIISGAFTTHEGNEINIPANTRIIFDVIPGTIFKIHNKYALKNITGQLTILNPIGDLNQLKFSTQLRQLQILDSRKLKLDNNTLKYITTGDLSIVANLPFINNISLNSVNLTGDLSLFENKTNLQFLSLNNCELITGNIKSLSKNINITNILLGSTLCTGSVNELLDLLYENGKISGNLKIQGYNNSTTYNNNNFNVLNFNFTQNGWEELTE